MNKFKGDIGLFRLALVEAGFNDLAKDIIFNDDSNAKPKTGVRRLKLWFATEVFNAPQKQQLRLEKSLRELFEHVGKEILCMYFVQNSTPYGGFGSKSLCIKLQD
jgi:hypothetical protein